MGEIPHTVGYPNAPLDAFIFHLIPVHRHGEGVEDTLFPGGVEVVDDNVGFQIVPVGGIGHRICIRLGRNGKGDFAGTLILNGNVRCLLIEVHAQFIALRHQLIVLIARQLGLFH